MENSSSQEAPSKQELANTRTDWAQERTLLAKERTFSAWVRTGIAAVAAGLGLARLLTTQEPRWLVQAMGALFLVTGAAIFVMAFWRYRKIFHKLKDETSDGPPVWLIGMLTILLVSGAGAGLALIFLD